MAKRKHVTEMTDEEVADIFINFGRNLAYYGVMEVVRVAARQVEDLESVNPAELDGASIDQAAAFLQSSYKEVLQAAGIRNLIAGVVWNFAFHNEHWEDSDFDPDRSRSKAVAELLLKHAAEANRKADEPIDDEE
ncbi:hypothetical protein GCM10010149_88160 [Nonomuraea roseoviolacea subsp. roseoviolacea]|uniref:hypothetical protein n=1 Tax=Nonomuraea roseoviolacea TaxID=103837 RepID=UPI0031E39D7C